LYLVSLFDLIDYFDSFHHFSKNGVIPVEMLRIFPIMTNKELRSTGIPSGVRH
jgi:hypothetical protein